MSAQYFDRILGHVSQKAFLTSLSQQSERPHAYIFSGPKGVGKRTIAQAFARALLGVSAHNENELLADFHLVTREEEKRDITVDQIRTLNAALRLKPYYGKGAVAIIDNAHEMSIPASNALLKTLEEPEDHRYLVLVTDAPHLLLETIISRCQVFHFGLLSTEDVRTLIERLCSVTIPEESQQKELQSLCSGSLEALHLEAFIDNQTMQLKDVPAFRKHCLALVASVQKHETRIMDFLQKEKNSAEILAHGVSLATNLSSDKDNLPRVWDALHLAFRKKLRDGSASAATASQLLALLEREEKIRERSLNSALQLSDLLTQSSATSFK